MRSIPNKLSKVLDLEKINFQFEMTKLSGLALWGAWVGLLGGIVGILGGGLILLDRFIPPRVEILGILPFALHSKEKMIGIKEYHSAYGISAIVHIRSKDRSVLIGGLDLSGKIYLNVNDYLPYTNCEGRHINDIAKELKQKKPYNRISWSAWPKDSNVAVKLEPHEERYILFIFQEPTLLSGKECGIEFLGVESENEQPSRVRTRPDRFDIFKHRVASDKKSVIPFDLRDEIKQGLVRFDLRVGPKSVKIPTPKIKGFKIITKKEWDELSPQELFYQ